MYGAFSLGQNKNKLPSVYQYKECVCYLVQYSLVMGFFYPFLKMKQSLSHEYSTFRE